MSLPYLFGSLLVNKVVTVKDKTPTNWQFAPSNSGFVPSVGLGFAVSLSPSFHTPFAFLSLSFLLENEARRSFIHSHSFRHNRSFPQVSSEEIE